MRKCWAEIQADVTKCSRCATSVRDVDVSCPPGLLYPQGVEPPGSTRVRALERHLVWVKAEALCCGWGEPEWLFPNDEGKPHDESRVRRFHKKGLKDAKLPSFRLYDLRHTYASLLLAAGAPITYVSAD